MDNKYTVGIITASDKGSKGEREDISGRRIREILPAENYEVVSYKVLPDEQEELEQEMIHLADGIFHAGCDTGGNTCGL